MKEPITAFIGLFEEKLKRLKNDLKEELKLAKSDRRKEVMKRLVTEAKGLQKTIKSVKPDEPKKYIIQRCVLGLWWTTHMGW